MTPETNKHETGSGCPTPTCSAGSDTPEVDKLEAWLYERRPDQYTVDRNRIELAKRLEKRAMAYAATIREFLDEATDFAESRRGYLRFLRLADEIDDRHPEISEPNVRGSAAQRDRSDGGA